MDQMEKEVDLLELFKVLLSKLWILLICMIVGGLIAFTVSRFVMQPEYESNTTMYVMNYNVNAGYSNQENNIDQGDLNTSKTLASTYITVLKSNAVMEEVANRLWQQVKSEKLEAVFPMTDKKISNDTIRKCFSMSTVDDTEVIKITSRTTDPEVSAQMCNILADVAPSFLLAVVKAGSVEIIDVAVPNEKPVSPRIPRNTLLGILIGLILSSAVIILLYMLDDTVKDKEELAKDFERPTLGEVQRFDSENTKQKGIFSKFSKKKKGKKLEEQKRNLIIDENIPFNVKESYKTLRTNIFFALGTSSKKIFAVSSVNPSEGKSTTAANIAIAFAQSGSKVLLIDADMRKPVQHTTFRVGNKEGLSSLIVQISEMSRSIKHTSVERLDLLPSGPIPPNPSELLASDRFKELLDFFSQSYDYIILDTPPISVVTDAMVMRDAISGILLVLRYGSTKEQDVAECLRKFEFSEVNMLGFVLNDIQRQGGMGYYRTKKYGYGYGKDGYGYGYGYGYGKSDAQMKEYIPDEIPSNDVNASDVSFREKTPEPSATPGDSFSDQEKSPSAGTIQKKRQKKTR